MRVRIAVAIAGALVSLVCHGANILRVGTSGDYAPFSFASLAVTQWPRGLSGFDVAVIQAYARDRGMRIQWQQFRWPTLVDALQENRFDVAVGGITVRPERSVAGTFTVPLAQGGATLLLKQATTDLASLDRPGRVLAVNAGGHLERVARGLFSRATVRAIPDNQRVMAQLEEAEVAGVVTDSFEASVWLAQRPGLYEYGPLNRDRKAWLVRAGLPGLAADLDQWLVAQERAGTLARLRAAYFRQSDEQRSALPVSALVAAVDERLALMPWVAREKQRLSMSIEDKPRESRVIASALEQAAAVAPLSPQLRAAVEQFFLVQIEAAKDIQRATIALPAQGGSVPDLQQQLRPALIRIGARISRLITDQQAASTEMISSEMLREQLNSAPLLSPERVREIVDSLIRVSSAAPAP